MRSYLSGMNLVSAGVLAAAFSAPALAAPSTAGDDTPIYQGTVAQAAGRSFSISANLRTLYDSNLLRRGDGLTPRAGDSNADYRISPSVTGEFNLPVGRQQLYLNGTVGRDYFVRNQRLDRNRFQIAGGATLAAGSSCTATLNTDFTSRQVLLSELGELVPNSQKTFNYGASANCASAVGLGFGGGVRRTQVRNDNPSREVFELNGTAYTAQLSYKLGNIGAFSASGSLNQVTYLNRPVLTLDGDSVQDGVDIVSGRFGYQRDIGSRLAVNLGLSYFESKPQPGSVLEIVGVTTPPAAPGVIVAPRDRDTFSGLGYDASITYKPSERMAVILAANRSASASVNVGAVSQVQTGYLVDIDYTLGSGIRLGTGASYNRRQYQDSIITAPDLNRRRLQDKITRIYANAGYTTSRLLSLAVEVAYQDRQSLPVEFSFDSFSASLNLTLKFGRKS